jgi:hypothetical protein
MRFKRFVRINHFVFLYRHELEATIGVYVAGKVSIAVGLNVELHSRQDAGLENNGHLVPRYHVVVKVEVGRYGIILKIVKVLLRVDGDDCQHGSDPRRVDVRCIETVLVVYR